MCNILYPSTDAANEPRCCAGSAMTHVESMRLQAALESLGGTKRSAATYALALTACRMLGRGRPGGDRMKQPGSAGSQLVNATKIVFVEPTANVDRSWSCLWNTAAAKAPPPRSASLG